MNVARPLAMANELIRLLADQESASPSELAPMVNVPRTSLLRLLDGLKAVNLVESMPDGRVRLSLRWLHLAEVAREARIEWVGAHSALETAARRTGQTAFLTVPWGRTALCIEWSPGRGIDLLVLKPGRALPIHAGAAGRTMLAFSDLTVQEQLGPGPLQRLTSNTIVDSNRLRLDAEATRSRGYGLSLEDVTIGIGAIGAPVLDFDGKLRGCLSVGGLIADIQANEASIAKEVQRLAKEI